ISLLYDSKNFPTSPNCSLPAFAGPVSPSLAATRPSGGGKPDTTGTPLSGHHERKPRVWKLDLRRVDCRGHGPCLNGRRELICLQTGGQLLQRVARGDLRLAPPVHVPAAAQRRDGARGGPFHLQQLEPPSVDRLERQLRLEARVGRRVQVDGRLERALAIEVETEALEAQGAGGARVP